MAVRRPDGMGPRRRSVSKEFGIVADVQTQPGRSKLELPWYCRDLDRISYLTVEMMDPGYHNLTVPLQLILTPRCLDLRLAYAMKLSRAIDALDLESIAVRSLAVCRDLLARRTITGARYFAKRRAVISIFQSRPRAPGFSSVLSPCCWSGRRPRAL